jgi:hypothetical protein
VRECCFGVQPVGIVAQGGQELSGDFVADAGQGDQAWGGRGDQRAELAVGFGDLGAEVVVAAGEAAQRCLGGGRRGRRCRRSGAVGRTSAISAVVVSVRELLAQLGRGR